VYLRPDTGTLDGIRGPRVLTAIAVAFLATAALAQTSPAQQAAVEPPAAATAVNLNITPKRLTFGRGERSASVYIYNQGSTPATFDIAIVDRVMLPNGDIKPLSEAETDAQLQPIVGRLRSADGMVLATPRRATLAPGRGQTIRVRVTPPTGAAAAEYRSHLTVTTVPPRDTGLTAEDAAAKASDRLSFRVTSVFGLSIPVIIRSGTADAQGTIRNARLTYADLSPNGIVPARRTPVVSLDLVRSGANSLFGNVEIRVKGGKDPIGLARGVGVYTEIDHRSIRIPLQRAPAAGEELEIAFVDDDVTPGRVIAQMSVIAP
jgi:P pilus assembly chaperone PapD